MHRTSDFSTRRTNTGIVLIKNPLLGNGLVLLSGFLVLYFFTLPKVLLYFDSKNWIEVSGWVKESSLSTHESSPRHSGRGSRSRKVTYSINIYYSYNFNGSNYESNTYSFSNASRYNRGKLEEIVKQHPPGKVIKCYINPKDPSQSVLNKEFDKPLLIFLLLFPSLFIGLSAFSLAKELRALKTRKINEENWLETQSGRTYLR
jgi:hypothetical protein